MVSRFSDHYKTVIINEIPPDMVCMTNEYQVMSWFQFPNNRILMTNYGCFIIKYPNDTYKVERARGYRLTDEVINYCRLSHNYEAAVKICNSYDLNWATDAILYDKLRLEPNLTSGGTSNSPQDNDYSNITPSTESENIHLIINDLNTEVMEQEIKQLYEAIEKKDAEIINKEIRIQQIKELEIAKLKETYSSEITNLKETYSSEQRKKHIAEMNQLVDYHIDELEKERNRTSELRFIKTTYEQALLKLKEEHFMKITKLEGSERCLLSKIDALEKINNGLSKVTFLHDESSQRIKELEKMNNMLTHLVYAQNTI